MPNSFILFFCHVPFEQGIFFGNHLKCVFLLLAFITKWIEIYSGTNLVRILCSNFQHYYFLLILNESIDKCASYGVFLMINSFLLFIHGNFNWCTPPIIRSIRIFNYSLAKNWTLSTCLFWTARLIGVIPFWSRELALVVKETKNLIMSLDMFWIIANRKHLIYYLD